MTADRDTCRCMCHWKGSLFSPRVVDVDEPVSAMTACDLCAVLHAGVWTVVPRGYKAPPREPWRNQSDGEDGG